MANMHGSRQGFRAVCIFDKDMGIHSPRLLWAWCLFFVTGYALAVPADTLRLYPFIARLEAAKSAVQEIDTLSIPDPEPIFSVSRVLSRPVWLVYYNGTDSVRQFVSTEWSLAYAEELFYLIYDPEIITPDITVAPDPLDGEDGSQYGQDRQYRTSEIDSMLRGYLPAPNYNRYLIESSAFFEIRRRFILQMDGYIASILSSPDLRHAGDGNADLESIRKQYEKFEKEPEEEEDPIETPDVDLEPSALEEFLQSLREMLNLILILALIGALGFGLYKLNNYFDSRKSEDQPILLEDGGLLQKKDARTSDGLRIQAQQAYAQADYRECLRLEYVRFILRLHERRIIIYKASFTNWEYLENIIRINGPKDIVHEITLRFDEAVYGGKATTREDADFYRELVDKCMIWADER